MNLDSVEDFANKKVCSGFRVTFYYNKIKYMVDKKTISLARLSMSCQEKELDDLASLSVELQNADPNNFWSKK